MSVVTDAIKRWALRHAFARSLQWLAHGLLLLAVGDPTSVSAQDVGDTKNEALTEIREEVTRLVGTLTADSLRHRDTPSAALDATARHVAAEFQRAGLEPLTSLLDTGWIRRYPIPGQLRLEPTSRVLLWSKLQHRGKNVFDEGGMPAARGIRVVLGTEAYFTPEVGRQEIARVTTKRLATSPFARGRPVCVIAGQQTVASVRAVADSFIGKAVLYIPSAYADSALRHQLILELHARADQLVIASDADSSQLTAAQGISSELVSLVDDYMRYADGARVRPWAITGSLRRVREFLSVNGLDAVQLGADTVPIVRTLPLTALYLVADTKDDRDDGYAASKVTAPNVVGVLKSGRPTPDEGYVVVSAHMDNLGTKNDNTAGLATLLAIAKAFQSEPRPRRSVIFLATSGGARALWGAHFFADSRLSGPITAAVNIDAVGSGRGDSIMVDGLHDVELPVPVQWIAADHPELGLRITNGGSAVRARSDHFSFVRNAVPSLSFHTEPLADAAPDHTIVGSIDLEHVTRVASLVSRVVREMANAQKRPQWTSEGRGHLQDILNLARELEP